MRPDSLLALVQHSCLAWKRLAALRQNLLLDGLGRVGGTPGVFCVGSWVGGVGLQRKHLD